MIEKGEVGHSANGQLGAVRLNILERGSGAGRHAHMFHKIQYFTKIG
jgi:hypothetical protein